MVSGDEDAPDRFPLNAYKSESGSDVYPIRDEPLDFAHPNKLPNQKEWWKLSLDNAWSVAPRFWNSLKRHAAQDGAVEPQEPVVKSGANVSLEDIITDPRDMSLPPRPYGSAPYVVEMPRSEEAGDYWVGEPDPGKFGPDTTALSRMELDEERAKGTVATLKDFKDLADKAYGWEWKVALNKIFLEVLKNHLWIHLDDGKDVSFWNLYNYVHNNPELKALAERNMGPIQAVDGDHYDEKMGNLMPWELRPGAPKMMLDPETEAQLPWGLVANANYWSRLPTQYLKGLDGVRDFAYALYTHEDLAEEYLKNVYGGLAEEEVLFDPRYPEDLVRTGPYMGWTLMFTSSRDLDIKKLRNDWGQKLALYLQRREHTPESIQTLGQLYNIFKPERLVSQTQLLDITGEKLREGSTILMTTGPEGRIMVQAISPGNLKQKENYLLGTVVDEPLCQALLDMFTGPAAIDQDFALRVGHKMLFYINGFKSRNRDNNPNQLLPSEPFPYITDLIPAKASVFSLPAVGEQRQPTVVNHVKDQLKYKKLADAFAEAIGAATEVPETSDTRALLEARKVAAETSLRKSLSELGLDVDGFSLPPPSDDLVNHAEELRLQLKEAVAQMENE